MLLAGTPEFVLFSLILMRMTGFIFMNPIFGRRDLPAMLKTGMALALTILVYPTAGSVDAEISSAIVYGFLLLKEFALGYLLGFVIHLFLMVITYAGSVIDIQMGLSMATIFDPQSGTQMALSGNILQTYFLLLFFAVDGHLALLKIMMSSGEVVPYMSIQIGSRATEAVLNIFVQCIVLAVKLGLPIIAFEFLVEVGVGILTKMIPQINIFVLSIDMRVIVGLVMLIFLASPIGDYIENVITTMMNNSAEILKVVTG